MTQEDKDLLLKDLCARLPYGVKISIPELWTSEKKIEVLNEIFKGDDGEFRCNDSGMLIKHVKPYLFPISTMTDEQKKKYNFLKHEVFVCHYEYGDVVEEIELFESPESFEYLIENHFDYYGLIPMGLANDATGLNIY